MSFLSILSDPNLGGTAFTVERSVYKRDRDESRLIARAANPAVGCIHPGTPEQLSQLPEEDRADTFISVYTTYPLSLGGDDGLSYSGPDRILWDDRTWRIVRLKAWTSFGFTHALAVLV